MSDRTDPIVRALRSTLARQAERAAQRAEGSVARRASATPLRRVERKLAAAAQSGGDPVLRQTWHSGDGAFEVCLEETSFGVLQLSASARPAATDTVLAITVAREESGGTSFDRVVSPLPASSPRLIG